MDFSLGIVTGDNRRLLAGETALPRRPFLRAGTCNPFALRRRAGGWNTRQFPAAGGAAGRVPVPAKIIYRFIALETIPAVGCSGSTDLTGLNIFVALAPAFFPGIPGRPLQQPAAEYPMHIPFSTGRVLGAAPGNNCPCKWVPRRCCGK